MVQTLPTITVTDAQAAMILAAFGGDQPTAIVAYKRWLGDALREYVKGSIAVQQIDNHNAALAAALANADATLPAPSTAPIIIPPPPVVPPPPVLAADPALSIPPDPPTPNDPDPPIA